MKKVSKISATHNKTETGTIIYEAMATLKEINIPNLLRGLKNKIRGSKSSTPINFIYRISSKVNLIPSFNDMIEAFQYIVVRTHIRIIKMSQEQMKVTLEDINYFL